MTAAALRERVARWAGEAAFRARGGLVAGLDDLEQPMVLVERPTGVRYEHQCGGGDCLVRRAEGFLVPVSDGAAFRLVHGLLEAGPDAGESAEAWVFEIERRLRAVRTWAPWPGADGDAPARAGEINQGLLFDRRRLAEMVVAWVPVVAGPWPGWLIWENSD